MQREMFRSQWLFIFAFGASFAQHAHALLALFKRLSGSFAALGNILACPADLAQNDLRRAASLSVFGLGAGGLSPGLPGLALL
jgi:hypothetical protein